MNLKRVLNDYYRKVLKVHGISVADRKLSEEEIDEVVKELFLIGMDLTVVQEIIQLIDDYRNDTDNISMIKKDNYI